MSTIEVDKIIPQSGTDTQLGESGDTINVPSGATLNINSGATITNNGTASGFDTDTNDKVKVSTNDTTPGFLNGKLVAGTNISLTEGSDGGDETLTAAFSGNLNASVTNAGTFADARIPDLNASKITAGTIATARLGSGTASSTTFLAGDQTYKTAGGDNTPAFSAFLSSTQTASDATWTKVQCNTEVLDSNSRYDADVYYRFTPASTGYYLINVGATLKFTENTVVDSYIAIYKNGTQIAISECFGNSSSKETWRNHVLNVIINTTNTSDYYELYAYGDPSSGSVSISGNSAKQFTYFNATKIII